MTYELQITEKAKYDFLQLQKQIQKRIAKKLRFYISSKNPLQYAKKLKDSRLGTYRFRIGDYRVIFDLDKKGNIHILMILRIKHRKEVYEQ
jgi:mRNA interferase RelE/StbE